jgi:hypothetical protein
MYVFITVGSKLYLKEFGHKNISRVLVSIAVLPASTSVLLTANMQLRLKTLQREAFW